MPSRNESKIVYLSKSGTFENKRKRSGPAAGDDSAAFCNTSVSSVKKHFARQ